MTWRANFEDIENSPSKRDFEDLVYKVAVGEKKRKEWMRQ